jgi:preprotein translocase subunit SecG
MAVVGVASSQLQFWRQMGATASLALLGTILSQRLVSAGLGGDSGIGLSATSVATRASVSAALHDAFVVATGLILVALVASLFMRDVPLRGHEPRELAQAGATSFAD